MLCPIKNERERERFDFQSVGNAIFPPESEGLVKKNLCHTSRLRVCLEKEGEGENEKEKGEGGGGKGTKRSKRRKRKRKEREKWSCCI